MKRINITYGGTEYTLADTDLGELKTKLANVYASGSPEWLRVNQGEGMVREVEILLAPGISTAIAAIDGD